MPDEDITFTDLIRGEITFKRWLRAGLRHRAPTATRRSTPW